MLPDPEGQSVGVLMTNPRIASTSTIVTLILHITAMSLFWPSPAHSKDNLEILAEMCSNVLTHAQDQTSKKISRSDIFSTGNAMCQKGFSDKGSFHQAASSLGVNIQYAGIGFGLDEANAQSDADYAKAYQEHCSDVKQYHASDEQIAEWTARASEVAFSAHSFCVLQLPNIIASMRYPNLVLSATADKSSVDLVVQAFNGVEFNKILLLSNNSLLCKDESGVDVVYVHDLKEFHSSYALQCERHSSGSFTVMIKANGVASNPVTVPPLMDDIEELKVRTTATDGRVSRIEGALDVKVASLRDEMASDLNDLRSSINEVRTSLEQRKKVFVGHKDCDTSAKFASRDKDAVQQWKVINVLTFDVSKANFTEAPEVTVGFSALAAGLSVGYERRADQIPRFAAKLEVASTATTQIVVNVMANNVTEFGEGTCGVNVVAIGK